MEEVKKFVDIDKIIREKSPGAYKWLPRFVINYIKRKIHEDAINQCIWDNRDKYGYEFNSACLKFLNINITYEGLENLPKTGGVVVASNHPLGGIDGIAMIHVLSQARQDVKFIVNDILTNMKNFSGIFIGVNKIGQTSGEALRVVEALYASDEVCFIFPAGLVSRKQKGEIKDLVWKKSFVTKSILYNKPILPVYIDGKNSNFFYTFAMWRKRLGIKANLEMFFLPDEMMKFNGKSIHIKFGKPLFPEDLEKPRPRTHAQYAQEIKEMVYRLAKE